MFSIDLKAAWLIEEGRYNTQLQGRCLCVCVCERTHWWCGEDNNTINHCSWNIPLLKDYEPYCWWGLERVFAGAPHGGFYRGRSWGAIDLHPCQHCLDSCYQKQRRQWSLRIFFFFWGGVVQEHKQAIIYECLNSKVTWIYHIGCSKGQSSVFLTWLRKQ